MTDAATRTLSALRQLTAGNHFGDDQPCAVSMGARAEGLIGDPRHGRQKHPVADDDVTYPQRFGEFCQFKHAQKPGSDLSCTFSNQILEGAQCATAPSM